MSRFNGHIRNLDKIPSEMISSVVQKLAVSNHLWEVTNTKFSTTLPDVDHIIFKFSDNYPHSHLGASYKKHWNEWKDLLIPIIEKTMKSYGSVRLETSKIMFARLKPHGQIPKHVDANPSSRVPHKIHIPLVTNQDVLFYIEDVPYHLECGWAYELNNLLPHSVENNSDIERIHFIFDCYHEETIHE